MMNLERARELKDNPVWGEIVEELNKKIYHLSQDLHICTAEHLPLIQAEIKVYKQLINLPDEIIAREEAPPS